ncbi:930_t:CDS:2 [Entrophospora sp. SA101]|nr:930_t:CDS:2 [Entrophospora sp. SA101]CAJ0916297.1 4169_t:CDS:2 [Entrophospora sp. SA101]
MVIVELSIGQLAGLIEWTTLSKVVGASLLNIYGTGGQPALTGIKLWGMGSYKPLFGVSAIAPLGIYTFEVTYDITSVDADVINADPLLDSAVNNTFSLKELTSIRVCGGFYYQLCPGMKNMFHVDEEYAIDFNKTYSNNAMRYRLLKTSINDNISYPSYDFMMLNVTSVQKEGYGIIDTMVVDHGNGGLLINKAIKPNLKTNGSHDWSIQGLWLQLHVSCHSTNITIISWKNNTSSLSSSWIGYAAINNCDINLPDISTINDRGQSTDLPARSIWYSRFIQSLLMQELNMTANGTFFESPVLKVNFEEPKTVNSGKSLNSYFDYDVKFNSTLTSAAEIRCERYGRKDNLTENIVGVDCWTLLGFPVHTKQGIEQTLYSCASVVEASVKTIKLQSSITGSTNVIDVQTIPAQWYIEKGTLNIAEMNPWWGGVEFGEKLPNNSFLVSENTLLLPAGTSNIWDIDANAASAPVIAVDMMRKLEDSLKGYRGDGIGNLALLQQWKEEGLTEKDISGMYKRQWNDIMINMVTPTNQAKIVGTTQFTVNKTCYDVQFATQYLIAMFGLIIIFYILLASLRNVDAFNSLIKIRHVVQQMDLGKVIINVLEYGEANTVGPSQ